tara:strand:+ start:389 stop:829 length:441 start_codon:yes stop_codon:yes gene_type:complete
MPIKSFRGKIGHQEVETIVLHTNNGSTGYKIVKFEVIGDDPGATSQISTLFINTINPGAPANAVIDFSDNTLIGVAQYESSTSSHYNPQPVIVFDNIIFNQDIYVSNFASSGTSVGTNYHIELEQVKLDLSENTVATLKDIRNIKG